MTPNSQLIFREVPTGLPIPGRHTELVVTSLDLENVDLGGGVLVKNLALSLDPAQRGRMRDSKIPSYAPAYIIGKPINGYGVGEIIRSDHIKFTVGQILYGFTSFETYSIVDPANLESHRFYVIENSHGLSWTTWVGGAGMSGQTAWWGFNKLGAPKKGETIYVSAASGAVGQIVGQLAKREGLKVIASAGSAAKVSFLESLGFDVVFNYKTESTQKILTENPFDIFFDSVGGETLDTVLATINRFGRIIACGSVSQYNLAPAERHRLLNYPLITGKEIDYRGFIISSGGKDLSEFFATVPRMIASGELKVKEHVTMGLDNGEALVDMLVGNASGKAVISME